jgi:uncharacterized membrane protein YccC
MKKINPTACVEPDKHIEQMTYKEYSQWSQKDLPKSRCCQRSLCCILAALFAGILVSYFAGVGCEQQAVWLLVGALVCLVGAPLLLSSALTLLPVGVVALVWCVAGHVILNTKKCEHNGT